MRCLGKDRRGIGRRKEIEACRKVALDFDGLVLTEGELKQKIEKQLGNLYQELMYDSACKRAHGAVSINQSATYWKREELEKGYKDENCSDRMRCDGKRLRKAFCS